MKDLFVRFVNEYQKMNAAEDKLIAALEDLDIDNRVSTILPSGFKLVAEDLLVAVVGKEAVDVIFWWIYDSVDQVAMIDGRCVKINTVDELWDYACYRTDSTRARLVD